MSRFAAFRLPRGGSRHPFLVVCALLLAALAPAARAGDEGVLLSDYTIEYRTVRKQASLAGWQEFTTPTGRPPEYYLRAKLSGSSYAGIAGWAQVGPGPYRVEGGGLSEANGTLVATPASSGSEGQAGRADISPTEINEGPLSEQVLTLEELSEQAANLAFDYLEPVEIDAIPSEFLAAETISPTSKRNETGFVYDYVYPDESVFDWSYKDYGVDLAEADTEAGAEQRAVAPPELVKISPEPTPAPNAPSPTDFAFTGYSYRQKRSGRDFVRYASEFKLRLKVCPGTYTLRWRVAAEEDLGNNLGGSGWGSPAPQDCWKKIKVEAEQLDAKGFYTLGWIDVAPDEAGPDGPGLKPGYRYHLTNYAEGQTGLFKLESDQACAACGSGGKAAGGVRLGCIDAEFSLGADGGGQPAGSLRLLAENIGADTHLPAGLRAIGGTSTETRFERDAFGDLRQAASDRTIIDVVPLASPAEGYQLKFYHAADATGWAGSLRTFAAVGGGAAPSPFLTWTVRRLADAGGYKRIQLTREEGGGSFVHVFSQNTFDPGQWIFSETNGLRTTSRTRTDVSTTEYVQTTVLSDAAYGPALEKQERFVAFDWGWEVVEKVLDPSGPHPLTTTRAYHTSGAGKGRLWKTTRPDGTLTEQVYAAYDTGLGLVTSRLASTTVTYPNGRLQTSVHGTLADLSGDPADAIHPLTTSSETLGGVLLRRSWQIDYTTPVTIDGQDYQESRNIEDAATSALWNDSRNPVTITRTATIGTGQLSLTLSPDGRLTRVDRGQPDESGTRTVTTEEGPANANGTALLTGAGGTRTEEGIDHLDRVVSHSEKDLASNLVTALWQVTDWDADHPELPLSTSFLDGSAEVRDYWPCCGKLKSVTRHGHTVSYTYDDLGRQLTVTEDGLTTETRHDAADRVRETLRYPAGHASSALVVSAETYDLAGRLTATTTPRGHGLTATTTQAETVNATTGETTTVTTAPSDADLPAGVRTEVRAADGSPVSLTGNATAPVAYAYATATLSSAEASLWGYGAADVFLKTTATKLDDAGGATPETVTTYEDALGRTIKTVYAGGATARNFYDAAGRLTREVDPDGVATLHGHETGDFGERTTAAVDLAATTGGTRNGTIDLDGYDRVTRTTSSVANRDGVTVRRTVTELWENTGSDMPTEIGRTEVSVDGLQSWQSAWGQVTATATTIETDGSRIETTTYPDQTKLIRTQSGRRLASEVRKDADGLTLSSVTYAYDGHGRLETRTQSGVGTTTYSYFDDDRIETVTTPDPGTGAQTTAYAYNTRGWVKTVTHPDAKTTQTNYYPNGQVKRSWGARTYPVEYTYDPQGRLKTMKTWQDFAGQSGEAVTTWNYDPLRGWLNNKRYNDDKGPAYTYTDAGRLHVRTWQRGVSTTYGYTDAGEVETITYSDGTGAVGHHYTRAGQPDTTTDDAGLLTRSYWKGRLQNEVYTGTGLLADRSVTRSFDARLRPESLATDAGYAVGFSYDQGGRLETVGQGFHLAKYGYKANVGSVEKVTVKRLGVERVRHERTRDALGRIGEVKTYAGPNLQVQRVYTYDDANQRTFVAREDSRQWAYLYDDLGQVTSAEKRLADGTTPLPGHTFAYDFDDIGNRTETTVNGRAASYTRDANRLNQYASRVVPGATDVRGEAAADATVTVNTLATTRSGKDFYRALAASNGSAATNTAVAVLATRAGPPAQSATESRDAFVAKTPEIFSYDDDGNLIGDGRWTYTWDAENRLIRMETQPAVAAAFPALKQRLEFAYDAQGRRIQKLVKTWDTALNSGIGGWATAGDLRFVYDGWNLLTETDALNSSVLVRSHAWGLDLSETMQGAGGVGGLLWSNTPTFTVAASADANGNIVAWVNTATLALAGRADYAAFGETVQQTGVAKDLPFGFSSKYTDAESGLLYYGYRYYNPGTGRWLSRDPIAEDGGFNLYGFVQNNPIDHIDVLGLSSRADIPNRLIYSENAGWIDWGHANPEGLEYFWSQFTSNETRSADIMLESQGYYYISYAQRMMKKVMGVPIRDSVTSHFMYKKGLSLGDRESVALGIFMYVTDQFEGLQASGIYGLVSNSGNSEEDRPSNLIGFYRAVRKYTRPQIEAWAKVTTAEESRCLWDKIGGLKQNSGSWHPADYNKQLSEIRGKEVPALVWPAQLSLITPAQENGLWRRFFP